jgi:hypothetical protein
MNMEINEKQSNPERKELNIDFTKVNVTVDAQSLINYRNILDASINRGTWKGNELTQIGAIYQKVSSIIKNIEEQLREQIAKTEEEAETEATEAEATEAEATKAEAEESQ